MALTALQLQWELATRMTPVNELRPFRSKQEQSGRKEKERKEERNNNETEREKENVGKREERDHASENFYSFELTS